MNVKNQIKRILSALLVFVLVLSCLPLNTLAADVNAPTIVIAGSDFQNSDGHSKSASLTASILSRIQADYSHADGFLFAGDYDYNYNDSANGKAKLQQTVLNAYPNMSTNAMVYIQGNHDNDNLVGSTLSASGARDADDYGVFVINEKDYMWYNNDEATIRRTAANLETYLNAKRNEEYTKPIFVISHLPLHYNMRTLKGGNDGMHANHIFNVLNEAGEAGLNIIFLFGHNHSHGWDDYLGGASIYLEKGDKINIAQNSTTVYKVETLAFTYMNAGYVGYYGNTGNGSDQTLTMTTFAISGSDVTIRRYDANGYHTLKASGVYGGEYPDNKYANPVYAANTATVGTPHSMVLNTVILPAGEDTDVPGSEVEGRTYTRVASASELVDGGKYLLFYSGSYFMLPEVVEKTNGSSYRKGFDLESTSVCGNDTITGDYQAKEWTLTASGSGWLLGNGTQYAKLTNTSDMSVTATFESSGDVFTLGGSADAYTFSTGSYVLNYNNRGLINGYASNPAAFWIYRMTEEGTEEGGNEGTTNQPTVKQIMSYSELQENVGYLLVPDEGEDITLTNQVNGTGLLLSGTVSADNPHLWYLDLTNEYIRYGSPTGSNNYLKVTNGGASVGSSSNRVTEILDNGNGTFSLYRSSYYMNRHGGSTSTKAAGYNQNNNGSKWKIYEIVAVTHDYQTVTVEPTCTEEGSVTTTCTICGDTTVEILEALGHKYESVTTDATCGADGSTVHTCSVCGDTYTDVIPATGNHTTETVTVEPTCTETGSVTTTCTVCGETTVEVIEAKGHSYTSTSTAANCTEGGYTTYTCTVCGYSYSDSHTQALGHRYETTVTATCDQDGFEVHTCTVCGYSYNGKAVNALGHSYESAVIAPTCEAAGYTTNICITCGHSYQTDEVPALGHAYSSVVTAPTCTQSGHTTYVCTVCGHSYIGSEVDALGHSYQSVVTPPTYEAMGYTTHTCSVCGDSYVDSYVDALTHTFIVETLDATCSEDGCIIHTCADCGYSYTETIPAFGHDYKTVTTNPTCVENGSVVSTCANCGDVQSQFLPATGHTYETTVTAPTCTEDGFTVSTCACGDVVTVMTPATGHSYSAAVTAPTCTEDGHTAYTCTVCSHSYTADIVAALGHNYTTQVTAPTCTEDGYTTYTCSVCGESHIADEAAALGHNYNTQITAPTCTEAGYTTYTCAVCGHNYIDDETVALDHTYHGVVTAPTCTEGGYTTYTCTVCNETYVGDATSSLGHSYTTEEVNGYLVYTCGNCGDTYSEKLAVDLSYNKVTCFTEGKSYVITLVSSNKYYALSHEGNQLSTVRVTVSNNKITSEINDNLLWNYKGGKLSYESNGTTRYLYAGSSNSWWGSWFGTPTLSISTTNSSNVSISNSKIKVGSYYLRYSGGQIVANRSSSTAALFQETAE